MGHRSNSLQMILIAHSGLGRTEKKVNLNVSRHLLHTWVAIRVTALIFLHSVNAFSQIFSQRRVEHPAVVECDQIAKTRACVRIWSETDIM